MITHFRNFAKSKWAAGLFVLLIISFAVVGSQMDVFANFGPKHVITAGDRSMNQVQFRAVFDRVRENVQEQAGRPVTVEEMVKENLHQRFLESQTRNLGFLAWAWDAGLRPGKDLIVKRIREIPAFFNQVTGQFDETQYQQALAQQGVTPADLEQDFRDQSIVEHYGAGLAAGARIPRIYAALLANQARQTRDGRWFTVTQAMAGRAASPTDAQLTAFMNQNAAQLRRPEFRMVSIILFAPSREQQSAAISEEKIRERFEFRKAALSQPEKRSFVTLTAPTREVAARVAAALRAGQSPQEVGRANNIRPADFDAAPKSALGDPAVAEAVFGMTAGSVSDPIQARVGFAVVKLTSVTPGQAATLEGVRDAIVAELRQEDARAKTYEAVEAYERARSEGKTLQQAVQQVGARIVQLPPFTQDGKLPDGQPLNAPPQVLTQAYALSKGGESEVIDAGQGQYFVIRVDDVRPSQLPTLADIRAPLAAQWTARENARLLAAKADELARRIRGGQDIAAVASSVGASVTTRTGVEQTGAVQTQIGQGVMRGLFTQGRNQVFVEPQSGDSTVIGRVDAIHAAVPALAAALGEQARPRLTQEYMEALVQDSMGAAARRVKARNDPALALQALGVQDPAAPAAPAQ